MTWGAVNEWTTQAGYARLAQRAEHPVLPSCSGGSPARRAGTSTSTPRRPGAGWRQSRARPEVVRWALRHLWRPVGSGIMQKAETDFVIATSSAVPTAAPFVERIDRRIERLPGLAGLVASWSASRRRRSCSA